MERKVQQFPPAGLVVLSHESMTVGNARSGRIVKGLPNKQSIDRTDPLARKVEVPSNPVMCHFPPEYK